MSTGKLIRVLVIAAGIASLVLFAWGIHDADSFVSSPVRPIFLALTVAAMAIAASSAERPVAKGTRTPRAQNALLALVQIVNYSLLYFLPQNDRYGRFVMNAEWVRWLGLILAGAGYSISIVALRTLGKYYSVYVTIQQEHRLVQHGIYGVLRHPIYLGLLLSWPGACLVFRSWAVIPIFVFYLAFALLRGAQEEKVLRAEFAAEFDVYRQRTWRIVPYLH